MINPANEGKSDRWSGQLRQDQKMMRPTKARQSGQWRQNHDDWSGQLKQDILSNRYYV